MSHNSVAIKLFSKMLERDPDGNVCVSPLSVTIALISLSFGARGKTRQEITQLLMNSVSEDEIGNGEIVRLATNFKDFRMAIRVANLILTDQIDAISETFQSNFGETGLPLEFKLVDFLNSEDALRQINEWVDFSTTFNIPDFLPSNRLADGTKLLLVNSVHFGAKWSVPFDESAAKKVSYSVSPTKHRVVELTVLSHAVRTVLCHHLHCRVYDMAFELCGVSCLFFIPNEVNGLPDVENNFTLEVFFEVVEQLQTCEPREVEFGLAELKFEYSTSLKDILKDLGVQEIFQAGQADFGGFSSGLPADFHVSDIVHKVVIDMKFREVEASAASGIAKEIPNTPPYLTFKLNRPHVLVMYHWDKRTILFIGSLKRYPNYLLSQVN